MQMGHATAEAVVRAGLQLVPLSFTGASEAVAVGNVGVSGIPVELIGPEERQAAMEHVKAQYPDMILIDFTLPSVVNGAPPAYTQWYVLCFMSLLVILTRLCMSATTLGIQCQAASID